jgi:lipopolysaccharide/colanic/teichoic acid biosynthesis glycosyltransferase
MNRTCVAPCEKRIQRLFDVACASAGLLILSPLLALLALLIALRDGRPVLFSQTRVGRYGEPFRIWKFRTMRFNSRGSAITSAGDSRITPTGALLRKYKLDELPQLVNVLRGDMSLVGPRPEVPEYVSAETPVWRSVLQVRPGITDLASLMYRDEEALLEGTPDSEALYREQVQPAKLALNLKYLSCRTLRQDIRLILLTVRYSLFPKAFDPELIQRTFGTGSRHERPINPLSLPVDR